uniref:Uncharacterized protein n=1 Tax=Mycena chlorophos TaxID=658473 RepID=A0ABQ0L7A6_MYCCL|nr:predicted protein [Mycena chlorophos]
MLTGIVPPDAEIAVACKEYCADADGRRERSGAFGELPASSSGKLEVRLRDGEWKRFCSEIQPPNRYQKKRPSPDSVTSILFPHDHDADMDAPRLAATNKRPCSAPLINLPAPLPAHCARLSRHGPPKLANERVSSSTNSAESLGARRVNRVAEGLQHKLSARTCTSIPAPLPRKLQRPLTSPLRPPSSALLHSSTPSLIDRSHRREGAYAVASGRQAGEHGDGKGFLDNGVQLTIGPSHSSLLLELRTLSRSFDASRAHLTDDTKLVPAVRPAPATPELECIDDDRLDARSWAINFCSEDMAPSATRMTSSAWHFSPMPALRYALSTFDAPSKPSILLTAPENAGIGRRTRAGEEYR